MATNKSYTALRAALRRLADPDDAKNLSCFFKTGPGEYGEGDRFLGIRVPALRRLLKEYRYVPLNSALRLLHSPWHEERLFALLLLIARFNGGSEPERRSVINAYLANRRFINNWDLVDLSAPYILGPWLYRHKRTCLTTLARSSSLWDRRIAVISTFYFIRQNDFSETIRLARMLLSDKEDLMHKAVGWMLREVGKRAPDVEKQFLNRYSSRMPRTMLRYAIERFPCRERLRYMRG
jgi:3-methyladenine DNA glycosylase AlkD